MTNESEVIAGDRPAGLRAMVVSLRRSLQTFVAAFESSPIGMCLIDLEGRVVRANPALARLLERAGGETVGLAVADLVDDDDRPGLTELYAQLWATRRPVAPYTNRFRRPSGGFVWVKVSAFPVVHDGVMTCFGAVIEDLTSTRAAERRFEALIEGSSERYSVLAPDWTILYMSPAARAALGVQPGDRLPLGRLHRDDTATAHATFDRVLSDASAPEQMVARVRSVDGQWRTLEVTMTNMVDDPAVGGIVFNARDVTELRAAQARFETMVERSADTYSILAPDMTVLYASPSSPLAGIPVGTAAPLDLLHVDDRDRVVAAFGSVVSKQTASAVVRYRANAGADGELIHLETRFTNLVDDPTVGGVMLNSRNITDEVAARDALTYHAYHDTLTGLPNRARLVELLTATIARMRSSGTPVVAAMIDLDRFKLINDVYGHEIGDELLIHVARRLRAAVGPTDTVARLGGDEFVVVTGGLDYHGAKAFAANLAGCVSAPVDLSIANRVVITPSIGIAIGTVDADQLLRQAHAALYRAKDRGRDCCEVYDRELRDRAVARHDTEQRVRHALAEDGFGLGYQPIIDLRLGHIVAAEALLRMTLGDPQPALIDIITMAEETGLIVDIGSRALRETCQQAARWNRELGQLAPRSVSVNVAARQLDNNGFANEVAESLRSAQLSPGNLCLELTETTLLKADRRVTQTLFTLKDLGVRLAIDDFGTGYASLTYLRRFPIDTIKIDRSFINGVDKDPNDAKIVQAVIGLGKALGITTIAEGVEHESQALALRALECDQAQGFHFAPALNPTKFARLLTPRL